MKKLNFLSIINLLIGLFLIISVFFPYGLGTNFFAKVFVFISGLLTAFDVLPDGARPRPKLYLMYLFTFGWMFFMVGVENAGRISGQSYNFTGDVFAPILLGLLLLTVLFFFTKKKTQKVES